MAFSALNMVRRHVLYMSKEHQIPNKHKVAQLISILQSRKLRITEKKLFLYHHTAKKDRADLLFKFSSQFSQANS